MLKTSAIRLTVGGATVALAIAVMGAVSGAQTQGTPERFTANAVNFDAASGGGAASGTVEITVNRWSTEAERDKLLNTLMEKGPDKLLDVLQDMPRVGYIRTPNSIGYDLLLRRRRYTHGGG